MQIAPDSHLAAAAAPSYAPGQVVARLKDLRTNGQVIVAAGEPLGDQSVFASRQEAFKAAYAGSLGAENGAMLVGRNTLTSWWVQPALAAGPDGTPGPWHLEQLQTGARPVATRGSTIPSLAAIIDGASIISPAS